MSCRTLLFPFSVSLENAQIVDNIRQSTIDLESESPSVQDVINLVTTAIPLLNKEENPEIESYFFDLFSLLFLCFNRYPQELLPKFHELFSFAHTSVNYFFVVVRLIFLYKHLKNPISLPPEVDAFVNESLSNFRDQIRANSEKIQVFGHDVLPPIVLRLSIDLLTSTKMTPDVLDDFINYFFVKHDMPLPQSMPALIIEIVKAGLMDMAKYEFLLQPSLLGFLPIDTVLQLLPILTKPLAQKGLQSFLNMATKTHNKELILGVLGLAAKYQLTIPPYPPELFDFFEPSDLTPEIWNAFDASGVIAEPRFASKITDFYDPALFMRLIAEPTTIMPPDMIQKVLETNEDFAFWDCVLNSSFKHPYLQQTAFWLRLSSFATFDAAVPPAGIINCLIANSENLPELLALLVKESNINVNICTLVQMVYNSSMRRNRPAQAFSENPNIKDVLDNLDTDPCYQFWSLFPSYDVLLPYINRNDQRSSIFLHGAVEVCLNTRSMPILPNIQILPQTDQSRRELLQFMEKPLGKRVDDLFLTESYSLEAVSLIAAAEWFGVIVLNRPHDEAAIPNFEGLTEEIIAAFYVIACRTYILIAPPHPANVFASAHKVEALDKLHHAALEHASLPLSPFMATSINSLLRIIELTLVTNRNDPAFIVDTVNSFTAIWNSGLVAKNSPIAASAISILLLLSNGNGIEDPDIVNLLTCSTGLADRRAALARTPSRHVSDAVRKLLNDEGIKLITFIIDICGILLDKKIYFPLNIDAFNKDIILPFIADQVNSRLNINLITLIVQYCVTCPKIEITNVKGITELLQVAITNTDEELCSLLISFLLLYKLTDQLQGFLQQDLPKPIRKSLLRGLLEGDPTSIHSILSEDDILFILCDEERQDLFDKKVQNIMFYSMLDENTKIHHLLFLLEKMGDRFCLTTNQMLFYYPDEFTKYGESLARAIHYLYSLSPEFNSVKMLFLKPEPTPAPPLSPKNVSLISKMIERPFTLQTLYILKEMVNSFPFFFAEIDIYDRIYEVFNQFSDYYVDKSDPEKFKTPAMAVILLHYLIYLPSLCDSWLSYVFEHILEFTEAQLFPTLILLRPLLAMQSAQHTLMSVLLKNSIPEIFGEILGRTDERTGMTKIIHQQIYLILTIYYNYLNVMTPEMATTIDELTTIDFPFTETYDHAIVTLSQIERVTPFTFLESEVPKSISTFLRLVSNDRYGHLPTHDHKPQIHQNFVNLLLSTIPEDHSELPLPPGIVKEAYELLPTKLQSTIWHHSLPPRDTYKNLSPAMIRYLVHQPNWIHQFIRNPSSLLLLPQHYALLYPVLTQQLEEVEEIGVEDFTLIQFCQADLFTTIINTIGGTYFSEFSSNIKQLLKTLANNIPALCAILEGMTLRLNVDKGTTHAILSCIYAMSNSEHFKNFFFDIAGNAILDRVCSWDYRTHSSILEPAGRIFALIPELPDRALYLVCFMLFRHKDSLTELALEICSHLRENVKEMVVPYIQDVFNTVIGHINVERPNRELVVMLKKFPVIAVRQQQALLGLLKQLLDKVNKDNIELIGVLCDGLAPQKAKSVSLMLSDSISLDQQAASQQLPQRGEIPHNIFVQAPEFWSIYSEFKAQLDRMITEDPLLLRTHLKFLTRFPMLVAFKHKLSVFHTDMQRRLRHDVTEIRVRRSQILTDSFHQLHPTSLNKMMCHFRVSFQGENGYDAGGVRRDWFTQLVKEIFNPNYALFTPSANQMSQQPNPSSYVNPDHIAYFTFAGAIIARAIIEDVYIDAHLTTSFLKHILGVPVSLRDLEDVDETLHNSLKWMLENDVSEIGIDFTTRYDDIGVNKQIDLKPGGSKIEVTNENKDEYVKLIVEHRLKTQMTAQIKAFTSGFYAVIPAENIRIFTPNELDLLICGIPEISVDDMRENTEFTHPYTKDHHVIQSFFNVISTWDREKLAKLLLFITGSSQVPIGGFATFKDSGQPIRISPGGLADRLPAAHTCMNTLDLPEYQSDDDLSQKLLFAIHECDTFGFI